ncbi:40S ribosomal protein S17-4 [Striga hermonthica]|uniref:40S ribosomal protein S17-4 n=1 Tax=Striga hermonthica TaxID=68872 RepID=A0A9N7NU68_STRHE|nr:40S ribosomal protein S17-4 [Striga hermonthica]
MTLDFQKNKKILEEEEDRERRMDFVSEESVIRVDRIEVDQATIDLLESLEMKDLPDILLKDDKGPIVVALPMGYDRGGGGGRRYLER